MFYIISTLISHNFIIIIIILILQSPPRARGALACCPWQVSETLDSHLLVVSGVSSCGVLSQWSWDESWKGGRNASPPRRLPQQKTSDEHRKHIQKRQIILIYRFLRTDKRFPPFSLIQHETSYPYFYRASSTTTTEKAGRKEQNYNWLQKAIK